MNNVALYKYKEVYSKNRETSNKYIRSLLSNKKGQFDL